MLTAAERFVERASGTQAVLLYGSPGAGLPELARRITRSWICAEGGCGECRACQAFERGNLADVLEVAPFSGQNQMILAQIVSVDNPPKEFKSIPIDAFSRSQPLMSRNKVVVVHQADRMMGRSANSFLKMLEEPPPYMRYVLWTNSLGTMLGTIRSRCATLCCPTPISEGEDWLHVALPWTRTIESATRERFEALAAATSHRNLADALKLSEELRNLADVLEPAEGGKRIAVSNALELFGTILVHNDPTHSLVGSEVAQASRRVLGNCHSNYVLDDLFLTLLTRQN